MDGKTSEHCEPCDCSYVTGWIVAFVFVLVCLCVFIGLWLNRKYKCMQTENKHVEEKELIVLAERERATSLENRLRDAEHRLHEETTAKNDALTRLSEIASSKLRDNNPNIADLNDPNRPTKLGEKMSELYDNEWTEAFQCLEKRHGQNERQCIDLLLMAVTEIYLICRRKSSEQLQMFLDPWSSDQNKQLQQILTEAVYKSVPVAIKDARKKMSAVTLKTVQEGIKKSLQSQQTNPDLTMLLWEGPCMEYIAKCTELCWLMCIQDPPVTLEQSGAGSPFNTNQYRAYTRAGSHIEYIVWPMVKLHDNGPLLCKGVAQGYNGEHSVVPIN